MPLNQDPLSTPTGNTSQAKRQSGAKLRLLFMGTPAFACPGLQAIIEDKDLEVIGVITQPDRPAGRHHKLQAPAIKTLALKNNLPIWQPPKIQEVTAIIENLRPDLCLVIAYGQIIPPDILALTPLGFINVHASLLPKYRGAACLNAPILNGDAETGVTIMLMEAGLDTGPILRQAKIKLSEQETLPSLHDKLAELSAAILPDTIKDWAESKIKPQIQNKQTSSYVRALKKSDGLIDWKQPAKTIERLIRAYNPWPGTYSHLSNRTEGQLIKILEAKHKKNSPDDKAIGTLFVDGNNLLVRCGQDCLLILKLQLPGGRVLSASEFMSGYQHHLNKILA